MAKRGRFTPARRSGGNRTVAKLKGRISASYRKRAAEKKERQAAIASVAGGAMLGFVEKQGWQNPLDIPNVPDAAVYGTALYLLGDMVIAGNAGQWARGLGVGMATCAVRDMVAQS